MGKDAKLSKEEERLEKRYGITDETVGAVIEIMREEMEISGSVRFLGYCVLSLENDDFLARVEKGQDVDQRMFSKRPEHALLYPSYKPADKQCSREKGQIVAGMFETGDQYFRISAEELVPAK